MNFKLEDACYILLEKSKNKKKIKCYKVFGTDLGRYIAIHPNVDHKDKKTSITDVETGLKIADIEKPIDKVQIEEVNESINNFIKHYTLEAIQARIEEYNEKIKEVQE